MPQEAAAQAVLDAPNGPWVRLVSAKWGVYPLTIYQNPDRVLLVTLFDGAEGQVKGIIVLMRRVLVYEGDLSKLITTRRELILLEKIAPTGKLSYLLIASTPAYINYSEEEFLEEVKKQYTELSALENWVKELLEGYNVKAKSLFEASDEQVQNLLGDPYIMFALLNPQAARSRAPLAIPKFLLGMGIAGEAVEAKLDSLSACVIVGGEAERRLHAMHLLIESALQANVPCLVFDSTRAFAGFSELSKNTAKIREFRMPLRSMPFPLKSFELGKTLFADLSLISEEAFLKAFALENADVAGVMKAVYSEKHREFSSLNDFVAALGAAKETRESPQYIINKAVRVASVLQRAFQGFFGKIVTPELLTPWQESAGRVFYVDLSAAPSPQLRRLIFASILEVIPTPPTNELSLLLAFEQDARDLQTEVALVQKRFAGKGIGFIFHAASERDVTLKHVGLKLEAVGNELVATEFGEKPKRLVPKPAYTECSELLVKQVACV